MQERVQPVAAETEAPAQSEAKRGFAFALFLQQVILSPEQNLRYL